MKTRLLTLVITFLMMAGAATAQTSWLDRPITRNWNNGDGNVPNAPRTLVAIEGRCRDQIRNPESLSDRAVTRAGWSLFGASQTYGAVTVVAAMASVDGMCRPTQYNTFVFVNNRFAGTLSPTMMDSRTDGALTQTHLNSSASITAEFTRYASSDPLCCPSQTSTVNYNIGTGGRAAVKAETVDTSANCQNDGGIGTQDNVISGTVTYRQRSALPPNAVITVKLVDVSRQDTAAGVIAEDRIDTAGKQVPISFDLVYDWSKIQERNRYIVRAEIRDGERLLFTTDTSYPVITQGNPRSVEVVVVPVRGGGNVGSGVIRGTVTYLQRSALAPNSAVNVRLVDSADPNGPPVAETSFSSANRQVPIPFELRYEPRDINRQRDYVLFAEIRSEGRLVFKTEQGQAVTLRGGQTGDVAIVLVPALDEAQPVTGQTLSLSKFGTGSMQIEGRASMFVIRASVNVRPSGDAEVTVSRLDGSTTFSGKLIYFDQTTLRIAVRNSSNADASGEIEVKYSGRSLNSVTSTNLVLDGQNVTVRF